MPSDRLRTNEERIAEGQGQEEQGHKCVWAPCDHEQNMSCSYHVMSYHIRKRHVQNKEAREDFANI